MDEALTVFQVYTDLKERLEFHWLAGERGKGRVLQLAKNRADDSSVAAVVGYLSFIRVNQIQIFGNAELAYFNALTDAARQELLDELFGQRPVCLVIADGLVAPDELLTRAEKNDTPILASNLSGESLVDFLRYFLANRTADRTTLHGVFMEVMGIGVLLSGPSGVGKSELALELVTRGHRLIADDAPEIARVAPDTLTGTCPKPLQDFLEVRGLGILDIRAMFGDNALKPHETLRLIIQLNRMRDSEVIKIDRLQGNTRTRKVLDVTVPQITLPVIMGSNLAVLVEGAVRNHLLRMKGYNASESFISRQRRFISESDI